jgi:hypothetical protein
LALLSLKLETGRDVALLLFQNPDPDSIRTTQVLLFALRLLNDDESIMKGS